MSFNFFDKDQQKQRAAAAAVKLAQEQQENQQNNNNNNHNNDNNTMDDDDFPAPTSNTTLSAQARHKLDKEKMPWVEKYRPEQLSEVISHGPILDTIDKLISSGGMPHLLLHGQPGTGKTSTALAIARRLNGNKDYKRMVLELNASDERGIDTVRDKIKEFASSRQIIPGGMKLIILDEADSMTRVAQFALRRVMEMYAKTTRFIIIANYVNKIISALQSRCTCFRFGPLDKESVMTHLKFVAKSENVEYTDDGLDHIINLSKGDMRMCLNIMQACKAAYNVINETTVFQCTGAPHPHDVQTIVKALLNEDFLTAHQVILALQKEKGLSLLDIITNAHEHVLLMNLPDGILGFILTRLSDVEKALSAGCGDRLQVPAVVGIFQIAKVMLQQDATPIASISQ